MSAIGALRAATWPAHQRLEKRLDIKSRFATLDAYTNHLQNLWGFCAALEERVPPDAVGEHLDDYPSRRKLPLLARDLASLGIPAATITSLPRCPGLPACADVETAFGAVYVLEGATLGGRTLLPVVVQRLGLAPSRGAAFLASYGESVGAMWARFGTAVDAWCLEGPRRRRAEAAATATFEALESWLCEHAA